MDYSLDLIIKYPLIKIHLTEESDVLLIEGKICVNNRDISVALYQTTHIDGKQRYKLKHIDIEPKVEIVQFINNNNFENVVQVLDRIHTFLRSEVPCINIPNHCDIYKKVLNEYAEFTNFFLNLDTCSLKEDLTRIFVSVLDSKFRKHAVAIDVDYNEKSPNIFRLSEFDLPLKSSEDFKPKESMLALFDQFLAQIELLQSYFDTMENFDKNATILDPDKPKKKDPYRRVWLGDNISAIIKVDPFNIFQRPNIRFLGPDRLVESYSSKLNDNLANWVYQENVFQSVLDLLGLDQFPRKKIVEKQVNLLVEYGECGICFSLRLNEKLPEIICTNKSCGTFYHNYCIYQWLMALNAKRVFNDISGNCPNCERTISCPILD